VSARSKARKHSLDILYEADIRKSDAIAIIESRLAISEDAELPPVREYTKVLVGGVSEHKRKIDELIATYIQGWDIDRLAAVDRNILRIAIFEILYTSDIPEAVVIDEALTLAKDLSAEESVGYIHGVLAKITSIKNDLSL
jgi:N utilization substance protein B